MSRPEVASGDELLDFFAAFDVLESFRKLPDEHQERFLRWIDKAPNDDSRGRRIEALVLAMRLEPLYFDGAQAGE